jgi:xanthine dehydrogenase iron-sulfur cluster and FAD-binding subunit A
MISEPTLGPEGLLIPTTITFAQLAAHPLLLEFATGLIPTALSHISLEQTLAAALHHPGPETRPLLLVLLARDAEIDSFAGPEGRTFPMPGFLSYRHRLPPDKFPLNRLRLPSLNPDGHFSLQQLSIPAEGYLALRVDLHPLMRVLGHVRVALGGPHRPPIRLHATEHRLERQVLTPSLIGAAVAAADEDITPMLTKNERRMLIEALSSLSRSHFEA